MLSNVSSPFVVLEEMDPVTMRASASLTQQQKQQSAGVNKGTPTKEESPASSSSLAVRRRLGRFRSPGKPKQKQQQPLRMQQQQQQHQSSSHHQLSKTGQRSPGSSIRLLLGVGGGVASDGENIQLRELLLSQLDLIQRQSEDLIKKDRRLRELQKENEAMRRRLTNIEFRETRVEAAERKAAGAAPKTDFVQSRDHYYVMAGEAHIRREQQDVKKILQNAEVPGWRLRLVPPSYNVNGCGTTSMSSHEDPVTDENYQKRHNKPEVDEKRRKRWDIQRIREQRQVARLKARYEKNQTDLKKSGGRQRNGAFDAFGITHICVEEQVPVLAMKAPLPHMDDDEDVDFELPWKKFAVG